ncbi:MAG: chemoreceptor glutamine deamidase CheD [Spirochaetota bacterium]
MYTHFNYSFQKEIVTIHPGEFYVSNREIYISTVLGSCVAVALHDPAHKIGGLNHYMLPGTFSGFKPSDPSGRYGLYAMELLINEMIKQGAYRPNLRAKVFGGGNVLNSANKVGTNNAQFALKFLETEEIPIDAQDIESDIARKVIFDPVSGSVYLKKLSHTVLKKVEDIEEHHLEKIRKKDVYGDFILFES